MNEVIYKHKCLTCGATFSSLENAKRHLAKRHPRGAVWADGNKAVWAEEIDGKREYLLTCETHNSCVNFTNKDLATDWCRKADTEEFCEPCRQPERVCPVCEDIIESYCADLEDHMKMRAEYSPAHAEALTAAVA